MAKKVHLRQWLHSTKTHLKKLRETVHRFKKEQALKQQVDLKPQPEVDPKHIKEKSHLLLEFSMASVAKATLVVMGLLLLFAFLYNIRDILILIFIALFLSAALDSIVDRWKSYKIPRAASVLIIYVLFFVVVGFVISTLIPLIARQTLELAQTVTELITNLTQGDYIKNLPYSAYIQTEFNDFLETVDKETIIANLQTALEKIGSQLQNIAGNTWDAFKILFDGIFNVFLVLVLTFFMVVDEKGIEQFMLSLFPSKHATYIVEKSNAIKEKVGYWLRGQFNLMIAIAILTFIGLKIIGLEYALTLAMISGLLELLPVIGPIIAMVPALLIGLNISLGKTLAILITYLVIQQLEGNVLVPIIMNKAVGLSPLIIMVVMLIGFNFLGIIGIIISVPVATAVSIFIKDYTQREK